jgi:hypothetical protein
LTTLLDRQSRLGFPGCFDIGELIGRLSDEERLKAQYEDEMRFSFCERAAAGILGNFEEQTSEGYFLH